MHGLTVRGWYRARLVLDRAAAAALLAAIAPLLFALALVVRRDGGPAFIRVTRVGRGFEPFEMWKLRTMRSDGPDGRASGAALTSTSDDRITPIGRRLRRHHLDELPQLLNVVCGEMLLLGPRPETPEYVKADDPRWRAVLSVPPGIAGPTQVLVADWEAEIVAREGATAYVDRVLPVKLAIDAWYLRTMSPALDLEVVGALAGPLLPRLRRRLVSEVPASADITGGAQ